LMRGHGDDLDHPHREAFMQTSAPSELVRRLQNASQISIYLEFTRLTE
jgi:hypothetical protein